jgi:murein DD-endopeptidase MepM/ murein hydrolase activator NlpD
MAKITKTIFVLLITSYYLLVTNFSFAAEPDDLKAAIDAKTKALQEVSQKIAQTQKDLEATEGQRKTLQKEIQQVDYKLRQLDLGIRSSEITIEKLGLEVRSLGNEINSIRSKIDLQRLGISQILREIQRKDDENTLVTLLKSNSLAESMDELQRLASFNVSLSAEVDKLRLLDANLSDKLSITEQKKRGVESENENLKNKKGIAASQKNEKQSLLTLTKNQEENYQNLISELEKQQDAMSDEISKIEDQLRASFDPMLLPSKRPGVFTWSIKLKKDGGLAYITQHFGEKSYLYKGKPHNGVDIGAPIGTPILAADDGVVTAVDNNDKNAWQKYQYGKYVLIQHNNNVSTLYAHMSRQVVKKGDQVKRGDVIGYVGNTGYATGPHLHFGAYWTPSILMKSIYPANGLVPVGVLINPEDYL